MKAMNLVKAAAVAMVVAGSTGAAFAAGPTEHAAGQDEQASATPGTADTSQDPSAGYCYWETYCNVYGYCWTSWVCF